MSDREPIRNTLTMSYSAASKVDECPRAWWISAHLAWGGWDRDAHPLSRLAYALGKAGGVHAIGGRAFHELAASSIAGEPVTVESGTVFVRAALRRAYKSATSGEWKTNAKRNPGLVEVIYGEEERVKNIAGLYIHDLADSIAAFLDAPGRTALAEAFAADPETVRLEEAKTVEIAGVKWWYTADVRHMIGATEHVIIDWKTGNARESDHEQVGLYCGMASKDSDGASVIGLLVYLRTGEQVPVTAWPASKVEAWARTNAAKVVKNLDDPALRFADPAKFPRVVDFRRCSRCDLFAACRGHFSRRDMSIAPGHEAAALEAAEAARKVA